MLSYTTTDTPRCVLQQQFETVVRGLARQGSPAYVGSQCVYRGPNGSKCAAGQLIPDGLYSEEMEGRRIDQVMESFPVLQQYVDAKLASRLQFAHDTIWRQTYKNESSGSTVNNQEFKGALKMIAHDFNLDACVVEIAFNSQYASQS